MSKNAQIIGGLPAEKWIGRRVRLAGPKQHNGHLMRGTLVALLANGRAVVHPDGHRRCEVVRLSDVRPWWSMSPDLRELAVEYRIIRR